MKLRFIKILFLCIGFILISSIFMTKMNRNKAYDTYLRQLPKYDQTLQLNQYVEQLTHTVDHYDMDIPSEFEKVAENDKLELYLDRDTIAIAILLKENGYVWYSYDVNADLSDYSKEMVDQIKSGISMVTYNKYTPSKRTVLNDAVNLDYRLIDQGFAVTVDFTDIMIKFDVVVSIEGGSIVYEIPRDTMEEYNPKLWRTGNTDISINKIALYPFFGSTEQQDNGYIVIPDGTGAIIGLDEEPNFKLNYKQPVYGKDLGYEDNPIIDKATSEESGLVDSVKPLSRITMPIYGIIHEADNNGILVVAESGASYAVYNYVSKDLTTEFYQSYFDFNYRVTYKQYQSRSDTSMFVLGFQPEPNDYDMKQRVVFLTNEDANYVGVAKAYRNILQNDSVLSGNSQHYTSYPTKIDIIGNEIEQGIFKTNNVPTTEYEDAVKLLKTLKNDGFNQLDVSFKTFTPRESTYRFDVYRKLGGKRGLNELVDYIKENDGLSLNYYLDYTNTYSQEKETASRMSRSVLSTYNYSYLYNSRYMNHPKYLSNLIQSDLDDYKDFDISGVALDGFDSALFTHNDDGDIIYRTDNERYILKGIAKLNEREVKTSFYNPDAYLYPYVDKYYDMPYTSSEQMFVSASIPLLQLVLSGYMELYAPYLNFIANEQSTLLRILEYGMNPSYVMTTENIYELKYSNSSDIFVSEYKYMHERMQSYHAFLKDGLDAINGTELSDHVFLAEGISLSRFANGTTLVVNYTNSDYDYNGTTIEAKGYDVL